jgi:hypothetical protein
MESRNRGQSGGGAVTPDKPDSASAAARTGSGDAVCFGGEQFPDRSPSRSKTQKKSDLAQITNPRAVKEARLLLLREAVHEACGFIRLHAEACQSLVEAGDDAGLLHSLGRLVIYTKHAARAGNELRDLRQEAGQ